MRNDNETDSQMVIPETQNTSDNDTISKVQPDVSPANVSSLIKATIKKNRSKVRRQNRNKNNCSQLYCIDNCKHKRKANDSMIRCCLCNHWFPTACVQQTSDELDGIWNCLKCRMMPSKITNIMDTLQVLSDNISRLTSVTEDLEKQLRRNVMNMHKKIAV